ADHGELRSRTDPDHAGGPRRGDDQNSGGPGDPGDQSAHGRSHLEGRRRGPDQLRRAVGVGVGPDSDDSLPADLIPPAAASLVFRPAIPTVTAHGSVPAAKGARYLTTRNRLKTSRKLMVHPIPTRLGGNRRWSTAFHTPLFQFLQSQLTGITAQVLSDSWLGPCSG